jgi:hypothetical protein
MVKDISVNCCFFLFLRRRYCKDGDIPIPSLIILAPPLSSAEPRKLVCVFFFWVGGVFIVMNSHLDFTNKESRSPFYPERCWSAAFLSYIYSSYVGPTLTRINYWNTIIYNHTIKEKLVHPLVSFLLRGEKNMRVRSESWLLIVFLWFFVKKNHDTQNNQVVLSYKMIISNLTPPGARPSWGPEFSRAAGKRTNSIVTPHSQPNMHIFYFSIAL